MLTIIDTSDHAVHDFEIDRLMDKPKRCSCTGNKYVIINVSGCNFTDSFTRTCRCLECKKLFTEWMEG